MMLASESHYALLPALPLVVLLPITAAGMAAWIGSHRLKRRRRLASRRTTALLFVLRAGLGFVAMLAAVEVLGRAVLLATNWAIWPIALGGAVAVEVLVALYALERRSVSRRAGTTLLAARIALVLLVIAMLTQPVLSWQRTRRLRRTVAVLLDNSASMHVPDTQLLPSEKVRLGELFGICERPSAYRFEEISRDVAEARAELTVWADWLATVGGTGVPPVLLRKHLSARREEMHETFAHLAESANDLLDRMAQPIGGKVELDARTQAELRDVRANLSVQFRDRMKQSASFTEAGQAKRLATRHARLLESVRRAAAALSAAGAPLASIGERIDTACFASLTAGQKDKIDALAARTRFELASAMLAGGTGVSPVSRTKNDTHSPAGLLDLLWEDNDVKVYAFSDEASELDPASITGGTRASQRPVLRSSTATEGGSAASQSSTPVPRVTGRGTNFHAALQKVMADLPGEQLGGVIILSDGRDNSPARADLLAGQLGRRKIPVCSVLTGSVRPPRDAAVVSLEAPETVYVKDAMCVTARLKLDGLAGETVRVTLYDDLNAPTGDKDRNRPVDSRTVRVPSESYRTRIQLKDSPRTVGLHSYRVAVERFDGEVFDDNNSVGLTVSVTNDRTQLLIIEGRPRWEFRYLKNLFESRDRTVHLQYVLFRPDRIAGAAAPPKVHASASRPPGKAQANALPKGPAEWMKFDAIILGDVDPRRLGGEALESLRKFVCDRGGTLIAIAGPRCMPHAYSGTPLAEILPVLTAPAGGDVFRSGASRFRVALTAEGGDSEIMRQDVDPKANERIWNSFPEAYWRHPAAAAKAGATVLAFAMPPAPPDYLRPRKGDGPAAAADDAETLRKRREFERKNALIVRQNVALGRVLMLSFDRTWRMRYRVGDKHHHRFWGQALRWATAGKLPAGTEHVKLGTDRSRYAPASRIVARAKIVRRDLSPVRSEDVAVKVFAGERLVLRRKMLYSGDSPGMYRAELGELPGGTYRLELDAPAAAALLAADGADVVCTEFSVDPSTSAEQVELGADRGLISRLAELSGGVVVEPHRAGELIEILGRRKMTRTLRRQHELWNSWPLLALMVLIATAEWLVRKKAGLA